MSLSARRVPVQGDAHLPRGTRGRTPGSITWTEHEEAHVAYSVRHSQSAEVIAERGGFGYGELVDLLGRAPTTWTPDDPEQVVGSRIYFFGDSAVPGDEHHGHFLYAPGRGPAGVSNIVDERGATPWTLEELGGALLLDGRSPYSSRIEEEPQGEARLFSRDGWTLLALWDRTGDRRGGCVSCLAAEGEHDFDQMTALFASTFPAIWARITGVSPIRSHPRNPRPSPAKLRIAPAALRFPVLPAVSSTSPATARPIGEAPADELLEPAAAIPQEARRLLLEGPR